jgi:hypothetical protein
MVPELYGPIYKGVFSDILAHVFFQNKKLTFLSPRLIGFEAE